MVAAIHTSKTIDRKSRAQHPAIELRAACREEALRTQNVTRRISTIEQNARKGHVAVD
jgi:hypothetical protein